MDRSYARNRQQEIDSERCGGLNEFSETRFWPAGYLPCGDFNAMHFARICDDSERVVDRIVEEETVGGASILDDEDYVSVSSGFL